jgi:hypothetical protein
MSVDAGIGTVPHSGGGMGAEDELGLGGSTSDARASASLVDASFGPDDSILAGVDDATDIGGGGHRGDEGLLEGVVIQENFEVANDSDDEDVSWQRLFSTFLHNLLITHSRCYF